MKNNPILAVLLVLIFGLRLTPCIGAMPPDNSPPDTVLEADFRDYHNAKGGVIKARLVELNGKTVVIEKKGAVNGDGKLIHYSILMDTLSADDQAHIQDIVRLAEMEKQRVLIVGKIISVTPAGVLVDCPDPLQYGYDYKFTREGTAIIERVGKPIAPRGAIVSELWYMYAMEELETANLAKQIKNTDDLNKFVDVASMLTGKNDSFDAVIAPRKSGLFFIVGNFDGSVDAQAVGGIFYPCGTMQYTSVDNALRTVARYAGTPQLAIQLSAAAKP